MSMAMFVLGAMLGTCAGLLLAGLLAMSRERDE
jgi:hypothetical protein